MCCVCTKLIINNYRYIYVYVTVHSFLSVISIKIIFDHVIYVTYIIHVAKW